MAAAADTKVTADSKAPPLNPLERFGSIGGSSARDAFQRNDGAALEAIFQLNDHAHDESFKYHTTRGQQWEARCGLNYVQSRRRRTQQEVEIQYTPAVRHPVLRFLRVTPDFLAVPVNKALPKHLVQTKFVSGAGARREVELHLPSCLKRKAPAKCECPCLHKHVDQVFLEMFVSGYKRNDLAVSSEVHDDYLKVEWVDEWWEQARPFCMQFYEAYLAWFWEADPTKQHHLRRFLEEYNEDVEAQNLSAAADKRRALVDIDALFKRTPVDPNDIRIMQQQRKQTAPAPSVA